MVCKTTSLHTNIYFMQVYGHVGALDFWVHIRDNLCYIKIQFMTIFGVHIKV
jgi:hypothetical protein